MIKHAQLFKHDPKNGIYGDCARACIACLLDKELEEVPHFWNANSTTDSFAKEVKEYLATQNLTLAEVSIYGKIEAGEDSLQSILHNMAITAPDTYYLISGKSPRGTDHWVIGLNNKIYHDTTSEKETGLAAPGGDGYYWIGFLVPISIHKYQ